MREDREPFPCVRNPVGIVFTSEPEFPGVREPQAPIRNALGVVTQNTTVEALEGDEFVPDADDFCFYFGLGAVVVIDEEGEGVSSS